MLIISHHSVIVISESYVFSLMISKEAIKSNAAMLVPSLVIGGFASIGGSGIDEAMHQHDVIVEYAQPEYNSVTDREENTDTRVTDEGFADVIEQMRADVESYEPLRRSNESDKDEMIAQYGASCIDAMLIYTDSKYAPLINTDSIVSDMMSSPEQPCGDDPQEIRLASLRVKDNAEQKSKLDKIDNNYLIDLLDQYEAEYESDVNHNGALWGFGIGTLATWSLLVGFNVRNNRKYKYWFMQ